MFKKSSFDEYSMYPKSLDELDEFAEFMGGYDKVPSGLDSFDDALNKYRKKVKFKKFIKSKTNGIKKFFSKNYKSLESFAGSLKKTVSPKIVGVSLLTGLAVGGLSYESKVANHVSSMSDNVDFSKYVAVVSPSSVDEMTDACDFVEELNKKRARESFREKYSFVDKEFNREDVLSAGKTRGLTGILEVISSKSPSYESGDNIHVLAELGGVDLFDEDISLERGRIKSDYVGNGVNDMLSLMQVEKIYESLKNLSNSSNLDVEEFENNDLGNKMVESQQVEVKIPMKDFANSLNNSTLIDKLNNASEYETIGSGIIRDLSEEDKKLELPPRQVPYVRDPFNDELKIGLSSADYKLLASKYNSHKNKFKALEEIASDYNISKDDVVSEVLNSRHHADVKYSTYMHNHISKKDAANLINAYLNGSLKSVKENYRNSSGVDVSTNFYRALDDFSKKLGVGKVRKSKMNDTQKKEILSKLKKYV